jgi:hypothetical protein
VLVSSSSGVVWCAQGGNLGAFFQNANSSLFSAGLVWFWCFGVADPAKITGWRSGQIGHCEVV